MQKFLLALISLILLSCGAENTKSKNTVNEPVKEDVFTGETFGQEFEIKELIGIDEIYSKLENTDTVYATIEGKVESVCQSKGCWMTVVKPDAPEYELFVQFHDYGFFMPKDIAGRHVVAEGYAYKELISVEDLKHYAEDEGLSQEEIDKIDTPEEEVNFTAYGVLLNSE